MSKLTDTLKQALSKKQSQHHTVDSTVDTNVDSKAKRVKTAPPVGKKPPTRSAGRGR